MHSTVCCYRILEMTNRHIFLIGAALFCRSKDGFLHRNTPCFKKSIVYLIFHNLARNILIILTSKGIYNFVSNLTLLYSAIISR